jgi:hypothetical protein
LRPAWSTNRVPGQPRLQRNPVERKERKERKERQKDRQTDRQTERKKGRKEERKKGRKKEREGCLSFSLDCPIYTVGILITNQWCSAS